jgi:hypothetical protein
MIIASTLVIGWLYAAISVRQAQAKSLQTLCLTSRSANSRTLMRFSAFDIPGSCDIIPGWRGSERGCFSEMLREDGFADAVGSVSFVQKNEHLSTVTGTIRVGAAFSDASGRTRQAGAVHRGRHHFSLGAALNGSDIIRIKELVRSISMEYVSKILTALLHCMSISGSGPRSIYFGGGAKRILDAGNRLRVFLASQQRSACISTPASPLPRMCRAALPALPAAPTIAPIPPATSTALPNRNPQKGS